MKTTSAVASRTRRVSKLALAGIALIFAGVLQADDCPPGFRPLLNGNDLSGWRGLRIDPEKLAAMSQEERDRYLAEEWKTVEEHWRVEDGAVVNDGDGSYLTTAEDFGDIELLIEYRTVPKADSGIYLRGTPQVQIWDSTEEAKWSIGADKGSGGLWNNSPGAKGKDPLVLADRPFGEWNAFRILQIGERTSVWLNGHIVVDDARMENYWDRGRPLYPRGPIQLQTHGGEIAWRNIFVREITPGEANARLMSRDADHFTTIFDGSSLDGWRGAVDSYEIADKAITCKPGHGGALYFGEELADFEVRFEFKLPPGGNNGLAIRYPGGDGSADTAYVGMCELQVLDDHSPQYAPGKIDPRQAHGSAYGMVAAKRGYQRPVGEWNHQRVTVKGSKILVELNGTIILDTDLADVKEFMGHPVTGKDRKSGYFGFAGHGDRVMFRDVRVRKL